MVSRLDELFGQPHGIFSLGIRDGKGKHESERVDGPASVIGKFEYGGAVQRLWFASKRKGKIS
jgi:hypothetical protein